MGAYRVVFSSCAVRDLEAIVRFIARDDPTRAEQYGKKLIRRALSLSDEIIASSGSLVPQRSGARKLLEGKYLILYRVLEDEKMIRVLRFWHAAQDRRNLSIEEGPST